VNLRGCREKKGQLSRFGGGIRGGSQKSGFRAVKSGARGSETAHRGKEERGAGSGHLSVCKEELRLTGEVFEKEKRSKKGHRKRLG